jgi:pilus assembly protein Flp/PilA
MRRILTPFLKQDDGATAIEYGFIASLIAVAIVGTLLTLGPTLAGAYQIVANDL